MDTIEVTIRWEGYPIKIRNKNVFVPQFGTTGPGQTPHWSYTPIPVEKLNKDLANHLRENKLI